MRRMFSEKQVEDKMLQETINSTKALYYADKEYANQHVEKVGSLCLADGDYSYWTSEEGGAVFDFTKHTVSTEMDITNDEYDHNLGKARLTASFPSSINNEESFIEYITTEEEPINLIDVSLIELAVDVQYGGWIFQANCEELSCLLPETLPYQFSCEDDIEWEVQLFGTIYDLEELYYDPISNERYAQIGKKMYDINYPVKYWGNFQGKWEGALKGDAENNYIGMGYILNLFTSTISAQQITCVGQNRPLKLRHVNSAAGNSDASIEIGSSQVSFKSGTLTEVSIGEFGDDPDWALLNTASKLMIAGDEELKLSSEGDVNVASEGDVIITSYGNAVLQGVNSDEEPYGKITCSANGIVIDPDETYEMAPLKILHLPTTDPQVEGAVWDDNGVLKISHPAP